MNSAKPHKALKAVTMFFDIGRDSFDLPRSVDTYLMNFVNFFSQIECDLLIVTTSELKERINQSIQESQKPFRTKVQFFTIEYKELPLFAQKEIFEQILISSTMSFYSLRDRIPARRSLLKKAFIKLRHPKNGNKVLDRLLLDELKAPEYLEAKYLITVLSKPYVLQKAYECKFAGQDEPIAFMDFGFGHGISSFISLVQGKRLIQGSYKYPGILVTKRLPDDLPKKVWDYATFADDAIIPTGFMVIDNETLNTLVAWWDKAIAKFVSESLVVDDQTLIALFVANHSTLSQFKATYGVTSEVSIENWLPIREFVTDDK